MINYDDVIETITLKDVLQIKGLKKYTHKGESGIYFLVKEEEVIYVGQSRDVLGRIHHHMKDKEKDFDNVYYFLCEQSKLKELEDYYIVSLKPKLNKTHILAIYENEWRDYFRNNTDTKAEKERKQRQLIKESWKSYERINQRENTGSLQRAVN